MVPSIFSLVLPVVWTEALLITEALCFWFYVESQLLIFLVKVSVAGARPSVWSPVPPKDWKGGRKFLTSQFLVSTFHMLGIRLMSDCVLEMVCPTLPVLDDTHIRLRSLGWQEGTGTYFLPLCRHVCYNLECLVFSVQLACSKTGFHLSFIRVFWNIIYADGPTCTFLALTSGPYAHCSLYNPRWDVCEASRGPGQVSSLYHLLGSAGLTVLTIVANCHLTLGENLGASRRVLFILCTPSLHLFLRSGPPVCLSVLCRHLLGLDHPPSHGLLEELSFLAFSQFFTLLPLTLWLCKSCDCQHSEHPIAFHLPLSKSPKSLSSWLVTCCIFGLRWLTPHPVSPPGLLRSCLTMSMPSRLPPGPLPVLSPLPGSPSSGVMQGNAVCCSLRLPPSGSPRVSSGLPGELCIEEFAFPPPSHALHLVMLIYAGSWPLDQEHHRHRRLALFPTAFWFLA